MGDEDGVSVPSAGSRAERLRGVRKSESDDEMLERVLCEPRLFFFFLCRRFELDAGSPSAPLPRGESVADVEEAALAAAVPSEGEPASPLGVVAVVLMAGVDEDDEVEVEVEVEVVEVASAEVRMLRSRTTWSKTGLEYLNDTNLLSIFFPVGLTANSCANTRAT